MSKSEIRKKIISFRSSLPPDEIHERSSVVSENLLELFESKFSDINDILCYYPLKREIDLRSFYEKMISQKKNIYFPVTYKDMSMEFFHAPSLDEKYFEKGLMNIAVPKQSLDKFSVTESASNGTAEKILIITPGLAFAEDGGRIGYGGGCYDRFIARLDEAKAHYITVGVALQDQVFPDSAYFELEENDIRIDYIITDSLDTRWIKCQK